MRLMQLNAFQTFRQKVSAGNSEKWLRRMCCTVGSNLMVSKNFDFVIIKQNQTKIVSTGFQRPHLTDEARN